MKKIILILLFLNSIICISQSYRLIEKANEKITEKDYAKALKLLERASNADYGFCGTAYIEALIAISKLKLKLFSESKNDIEMSKYLDKIDEYLECENIYTLERIKLALKKYSKEELHIKIIEALNNDDILPFYTNVAVLKFEDNFILKMYINYVEISKLETEKNIKHKDAIIQYYTNSEYYKYLN